MLMFRQGFDSNEWPSLQDLVEFGIHILYNFDSVSVVLMGIPVLWIDSIEEERHGEEAQILATRQEGNKAAALDCQIGLVAAFRS